MRFGILILENLGISIVGNFEILNFGILKFWKLEISKVGKFEFEKF